MMQLVAYGAQDIVIPPINRVSQETRPKTPEICDVVYTKKPYHRHPN